MKLTFKLIVAILLVSIQINYAQNTLTKGVKHKKDFVVFEADATQSDLGLWVKRTPKDTNYYKGDGAEAVNKTYLEFTGKNLNLGAPSALVYKFKAPKTGEFRLVMRMYQPLKQEEKEDEKNDVYVKLEGKFTSACKFSTADLTQYHRMFGRGVRKWGAIYGMEGLIDNKKVYAPAVYNLIEDEVYTFTMSGKSQGCSIDYILFYDKNLSLNITSEDLATSIDKKYRP